MRYEYTIFDFKVPRIPEPAATKARMEEIFQKVGITALDFMAKEYPSPTPGQKAYTLVWILAESHAVVHTAPEDQWVEVVFALCKKVDRTPLAREVVSFFKPQATTVRSFYTSVSGRGWRSSGELSGADTEPILEPDEKILWRGKNKFQEIVLSRVGRDGSYVLYLDGNLQFISGFDDEVYHHALATIPARMLEGRPAKALILGGGDGLVARNLLRFPNIRKVTMVEIDPAMVMLSSRHPVMRKLNEDSFHEPRFEVRVMDARIFADSEPREKYDLAIVDFTDPVDSSMHDLFGAPFYSKIMRHLTPDSIFSVQSSEVGAKTGEMVMEGLRKATGTRPVQLNFRGRWMQDGTITMAGRGLKSKYAKLPAEWQAEAPDSGVGGMF